MQTCHQVCLHRGFSLWDGAGSSASTGPCQRCYGAKGQQTHGQRWGMAISPHPTPVPDLGGPGWAAHGCVDVRLQSCWCRSKQLYWAASGLSRGKEMLAFLPSAKLLLSLNMVRIQGRSAGLPVPAHVRIVPSVPGLASPRPPVARDRRPNAAPLT